MKNPFRTRPATVVGALLAVLFLGLPLSGFATSLQEAKSAGVVGEQRDGYVGVVKGADASIKAMVRDVNAKRKSRYQKIATKNGTSLEAVQSLAAEKTLKKTAPGHYVQDQSGKWVKK